MATAKSTEKTKKIVLTKPNRKLSLPVGRVKEFPESQANNLLKFSRDVMTEEDYKEMTKPKKDKK